MAVVNVKGLSITNRDATPPVLNDPHYAKGSLSAAMDLATVTSGDSIASKYRLLQVPSNARLQSLQLMCAALGAGCLADVGVYYPSQTPFDLTKAGTVISQAFFASAVDVSGALLATDILNESGTNTIDKQQKNLWDALGLAADPICMLDIVITLTAAAAATGLAGLKSTYTI